MIIALSCGNAVRTPEKTTEIKTPVTVVPVTVKSVKSTVDLPVLTRFMNENIIRATTAGTIEKILIRQGDFVAAGLLLFTIRTREAMALDNTINGDSSLSFKGLINIMSHEEGVINSISYQKGDFVQEGDEMAVISDQKSLVFVLEVPFEFEKYAKKAVLGDETQTEFWVMKLINDSTAIKVVIRKGYENNDEVEITEPDFLESDRIVLTGNLPKSKKSLLQFRKLNLTHGGPELRCISRWLSQL
jgi:biotin carboxyl carrier protein